MHLPRRIVQCEGSTPSCLRIFCSVGDVTISYSNKIGASLLSPSAFALLIALICDLEDNGVGANTNNQNTIINNYSVSAGIGMLVFDFILYTALGIYIDNVLPSRFREFGVPLPWYYPVTASYWQGVFSCCGRPKRGHRAPLLPSASGNDQQIRSGAHATGGRVGGAPAWLQWIPCFRPKPVYMPNRNPRADASFFEEPDANLQAKEREGKIVRIKKLCKEFETPDGIKVAV